MARDEKAGTTARKLAQQDGALIVINGGFFTPQHTSIGLVMKDGKRIRRLHNTSWWSVFAIRVDTPHIFSPRAFKRQHGIRMAMQVGPRLVIDGKIPKLKKGVATRSAVGITKDDQVVLAITAGPGISLDELARRMSANRFEGGLECPNAMALDGGSSSQLFAEVGSFRLDLPGLAKITNGLAVLRK